MRILHCADLHLDSSMTSNFESDKAKRRKNELLNTYKRMVNYAKDNGIEAIIIAGDLYDTKSVSASARNTFVDAIKDNPDITFYYLKGNHDASDLLGTLDSLPKNLKMFSDNWTSYDIGNNIVVTGVELSTDNSSYIFDALVLSNDKINIVVLHGQESDTGSKDKAEIIPLRNLKNRGIDYLALGHIHSYKCERLDARGVYCYPGCLEGRGYDECGKHGFVVIDIDEKMHSIANEFVPFASRVCYELIVDISDCMTTTDIEHRIRAELLSTDITPDDMLKVVLGGKTAMNIEKDENLLFTVFSKEYFHFKLEDNTSVYIDYNSYALDKSFKGEFVRMVLGKEDISDEDKSFIIKYGIKYLLGEEK